MSKVSMSKKLKKATRPSLDYCKRAIDLLQNKRCANKIAVVCLVIYEYKLICYKLSIRNLEPPYGYTSIAEKHRVYEKIRKVRSAFVSKHFSFFDDFFKRLYKQIKNSSKSAFRFKDYYDLVLILSALQSLYNYKGHNVVYTGRYIPKHISESKFDSLVRTVWYEFEQDDGLKVSSTESTCIEIIFNALLTNKRVPDDVMLGGSRTLFSYCWTK